MADAAPSQSYTSLGRWIGSIMSAQIQYQPGTDRMLHACEIGDKGAWAPVRACTALVRQSGTWLAGCKEVDWRQLRVVVGSEMLEFEATEYDRQPESEDSTRGGSHASPRGETVSTSPGPSLNGSRFAMLDFPSWYSAEGCSHVVFRLQVTWWR